MITPQEVPQERIRQMLVAHELAGINDAHLIARACNVPEQVVYDLKDLKERTTYRRYHRGYFPRYKRGRLKPIGPDICECCGIKSIDKEAGLKKLCHTCFEGNSSCVGDDVYSSGGH